MNHAGKLWEQQPRFKNTKTRNNAITRRSLRSLAGAHTICLCVCTVESQNGAASSIRSIWKCHWSPMIGQAVSDSQWQVLIYMASAIAIGSAAVMLCSNTLNYQITSNIQFMLTFLVYQVENRVHRLSERPFSQWHFNRKEIEFCNVMWPGYCVLIRNTSKCKS